MNLDNLPKLNITNIKHETEETKETHSDKLNMMLSKYNQNNDNDFIDPSLMADVNFKSSEIKKESIDNNNTNKLYQMEDNMMKLKHDQPTLTNDESDKFMKITENLYQHIIRIWNISDKLGQNIKNLGSKYRLVALENHSHKIENQKLELKLKALYKDNDYLEDVKQRYFKYRKEFDNLQQDSNTITLTNEIEFIKNTNQMTSDDKNKLINEYESIINDLNAKIIVNTSRIKKLTQESQVTKKHLMESTEIIDNIMEKQNCTTMIGGKDPFIKKRIDTLQKIQTYMDNNYNDVISTYNNRWSSLVSNITEMNHVLNNITEKECVDCELTIPTVVIENDILEYYLLFLYQLSVMKVISDKDCYSISKILGISKKVRTCKDMKKYFKNDIKILQQMIRKSNK